MNTSSKLRRSPVKRPAPAPSKRPRGVVLASGSRRPAPPPKTKGRPTYIVDDIVDFR